MKTASVLLPLLLSLVLSACSGELKDFNRAPGFSPIGAGLGGPQAMTDPSRFPPKPTTREYSLWDDRSAGFFRDPRAAHPGDVLTVVIAINDKAALDNKSGRSRTASTIYGLGGDYNVAGAGNSGAANLNLNSDSKSAGQGSVVRSEKIELSVAAIVSQILPNGNLVISGSQEVRVNNEMRVLTVAGIVRPRDISGANTISYEKIAEARISYGGRGRQSEVQQPPWGQQLLDLVSPI